MFKNRSFQKAILVLTFLALLAGAVFFSLPHISLVAGLPPCSATFGNCKLGPVSSVSQGEQMAILVRYPKTGG